MEGKKHGMERSESDKKQDDLFTKLISQAARATELFGDDELEKYAEELRRKNKKKGEK